MPGENRLINLWEVEVFGTEKRLNDLESGNNNDETYSEAQRGVERYLRDKWNINVKPKEASDDGVL